MKQNSENSKKNCLIDGHINFDIFYTEQLYSNESEFTSTTRVSMDGSQNIMLNEKKKIIK